VAYEYQCKKCKKKVEHYLRITYKCDCGGNFKNIEKPYKLSSYFRYSIFNVAERLEEDVIQEFVPVRKFGGFGEIWYWRKKRVKKI
jgi:hypothetical protein